MHLLSLCLETVVKKCSDYLMEGKRKVLSANGQGGYFVSYFRSISDLFISHCILYFVGA